MGLLFIDPRVLTVLPKELQGVACSSCDKTDHSGARWSFSPPGKPSTFPVCSPCFLEAYALTHKDDFAALLVEVEERLGRPLTWESASRLNVQDADRILCSIAVVSRIKARSS